MDKRKTTCAGCTGDGWQCPGDPGVHAEGPGQLDSMSLFQLGAEHILFSFKMRLRDWRDACARLDPANDEKRELERAAMEQACHAEAEEFVRADSLSYPGGDL